MTARRIPSGKFSGHGSAEGSSVHETHASDVTKSAGSPLDWRILASAFMYVVALLLAARLLPTWVDEEFTLHTTARGIGTAWHQAIGFESQAPLYFVLLAVWRALDSSVFFARAFSTLCALGFIVLIAPIARRVWPGKTPWPWVVAAAIHPFVVFAALEIRLYAFALLLSALLWLTFDAGFASGSDRRARVGFVLATIAAAWTQYYLAFVALALVAGLAANHVRRLRAAVVALVISGVGILPLIPIARVQAGTYAAHPGIVSGFKAALDPMFDFLLPHDFIGHGVFADLGYGLILLAAGALVFVGKPAWTPRMRAASVALMTLLALYAAAILIAHVEFVVPRHAAGMLVLIFAFAIALFAAMRSPQRGAVRASLAILYTACALATLAVTYHAGAKLGDWGRVGTYLNAHARPGDVVALFEPESEAPLRRYLHVSAPLVVLPQPLSYAIWSLSQYAFHSQAQAQRRVASLAKNRSRVWFVFDGNCETQPVTFGCAYLEAAVRAKYRTLSTVTFYHASVRELVARKR
jgi:hypothetical protein